MSLENELGRIATALEDLVKAMAATAEAPKTSPKKQAAAKPAAPKPPATTAAAPDTSTPQPNLAPASAPNPPATPASAPLQAPPPPAAPDTTASAAAPAASSLVTTAEEVNAAMVVEATRLGSPDAIRAVMADFGVASVNEIPVEKYQWIVDAVRAL